MYMPNVGEEVLDTQTKKVFKITKVVAVGPTSSNVEIADGRRVVVEIIEGVGSPEWEMV